MPTQNFRVGELLNKRTRNSKTWINFDGSYTTEIYPYDIHYQDEHGNWHNINTDLYDEADLDQVDFPVAKEGAEEFRIMKTASLNMKKRNILDRDMMDYQGLKVPFDCRIPKNFKRGYTVGKGETKLRFIPVGASPAKGYIEEGKKNCIHYQDAWNDTDVCLEVMPNGVKETIILKSDRAPFSFSFEVDGLLEDDLTAGNLKLQPAWLQDANGEKRDVSQTLRREGDKTFIDLEADVTGLAYPIEIDPTIILDHTKVLISGYVYPNGASINDSYFSVYSSLLGGNYIEHGGLLKFDYSSIPNGAYILDAKLTLTCYVYNSNLNVDDSIFVNPSSADITPSSTYETNYNKFYGSISDNTVVSWGTGTKVVNVTNSLRAQITDGYPKYGFYLRIAQADGMVNGDYVGMDFYSQHFGNGPKLTVIYNIPPTAPIVTSPNGGETWNAQHTITWNPATDPEESQSSLRYHIQLSTNNGQSWKDIVPLTSPGVTSYEYDFSNEPETSLAKIRIRAYDGTSYGPWDESDGVFTIQHNVAPTVPTNISPSGGTPKDRGSVIRLSWQHNDANGDPQAQFDLQWRLQGAPTWNTVSQATPNQYWDAPAGTFPRGTIEWRVRTYDQAGLSSPYSDIQTFFAGDKPANPTVTDPIDGATVPVARPTVQWSSVGQTAYHVKVLDVAEALLWEIQANSPNKAQTVLYDLQNNTDYQIRVAIKNADNLWSDFVTSNIHVSYTPPAVPIVTATKGEGVIIVSIDNPTPSGTQPNVSYNDLYRRKPGETWTRIATNIPADASFVDYTPASGQVYEYFVRAWGDNGTYSDSLIVSQSISLKGIWLHEADNPLETLHQFKLVSERSENWQPTAAMMQFAGRRLPVAEYDDTERHTISMKITVLKNSDDREALERLIRSKNTLCYRDARGRKMFCHAFQLPVDDEVYGNTVSLTFEEVSYTEGV